MTMLFESSTARIFDASGTSVVGAGFLVDEGTVLTCAHVVAGATGIPENSPTPPVATILLDFPLVAPGQYSVAQVIHWLEVKLDGSGDIAVLRLEGAVPSDAKIVRLVKADNHWEHPFRALGFPRNQDDGVPSSGKLSGSNAKGWVVMQNTETTGFRVQRGFSGGAVWDTELDGVAGMVVAEETDPTPRVAYMIPSNLLIEAWPSLGQQAIPPCPYRGLAAFREQDARYFFGRQADTQRLVEAVHRKPLVAVIGSSGSGKSSLVNAGLLPKLRKETAWTIATLRPGNMPLRSLAAALVPLLEPEMSTIDQLTEYKKFTERLMRGDLLFSEVVAVLTQGQPAERLLLFIDQFEELYTLCQDAEEQRCFLDTLLAAVRAGSRQYPSNFVLALTLRADFLTQAITYPPLTDALQNSSIFLGPMGRAELLEAITAPAEKKQVEIAEGLVERLLEDAGEAEGNLPLLEFALTRLWAYQQGRMLTHAAYDAIGGVKQALADHAQAVYNALTQDERQEMRRLFLLHLVRPGEGTQDTRRRATRAQVGMANWPLVTRLADMRLLVTSSDEALGEETVEVIHEALIRDWKLLRGWLDEDRELLLWHERLRSEKYQWEQSNKDPDVLLRGALLVEAQRWQNLRPDALTPEEQRFIRTSQDHEERTRAYLEALLEESERQRLKAEHQQQIALARGLAAQAELLRTRYQGRPTLLERSTLLALEAFQRYSCAETDQALRHGMELLLRLLATLRHEDDVNAVAFSSDGQLLATGSDDHTAGIWEVASGRRLVTLQHNDDVSAVVFSPDGRLLATSSHDDTAGIWEVRSGQRLASLQHEGHVYKVAFSPDGQLLVTCSKVGATFGPDGRLLLNGSDTRAIVIWEVATGKRLATWHHEGYWHEVAFSPDGRLLAMANKNTAEVIEVASGQHVVTFDHKSQPYGRVESGVEGVAFSPDGRLLATGSGDITAGVWEVATGKRLFSLRHSGNRVWEVAFSPDGRLLATAGEDSTARVWEMVTGECLFVLRHVNSVQAVTFSSDGKLLVTSSWDTVEVFEVASGQRLACLSNRGGNAAAISSDGKLLVTTNRDNAARVWEVASGRRLAPLRHGNTVFAVAFSPDGRLLATGSFDDTAGVWEVASGERLATLHHERLVKEVAFSPDGRLLATVSSDVGVWEVASGQRLATLHHGKKAGFLGTQAAAFSPDGRLLATGSDDHTAGIWEVASGQRLATLHHEGQVEAVVFSPDGRLLATASWDHAARIWEVASGRCLATLLHEGGFLDHGKCVDAVAFSPDGRLLATATRNNFAGIWEVASGQCLASLQHQSYVREVAFSPDGRLLATASWDSTARIWEVASGQRLAALRHESGNLKFGEYVNAVAFSPDGRLLATATGNGSAEVWEVASGQRLTALQHESEVYAVAFSPDGRLLATGSNDHTARLWLSQKEDLIEEARSRLSHNLTTEEWQQYLGDESYRKAVPDLP